MTSGFFSQQVDPNYRFWYSEDNVRYVQKEVARRLRQKYIEYIEVPFNRVKSMIDHTRTTWRGPLTLDELLEMVICDLVKDIDTDISWNTRFNDYNPRTLYYPGTGITRQEKVKLNSRRNKLTFMMTY